MFGPKHNLTARLSRTRCWQLAYKLPNEPSSTVKLLVNVSTNAYAMKKKKECTNAHFVESFIYANTYMNKAPYNLKV